MIYLLEIDKIQLFDIIVVELTFASFTNCCKTITGEVHVGMFKVYCPLFDVFP